MDMQPEVRLATEGLALAIERIQPALEHRDWYFHLVPVYEAMAWLYGLHEWWRGALGDGPFFELRKEAAADAVAGLVWARVLAQHNLLDPGFIRPSVAGPSAGWVASGDLKRWSGRLGADTHARDAAYDRAVAGRELWEPLMLGKVWMSSVWARHPEARVVRR